MAKYLVSDTQLTGIADAIRAKSGGTSPLVFPDGFSGELANIITLDNLDLGNYTESKSVTFTMGTYPTQSQIYPISTSITTSGTFIRYVDIPYPNGIIVPKTSGLINDLMQFTVTITGYKTLSGSATITWTAENVSLESNNIRVAIYGKTQSGTRVIYGSCTAKVTVGYLASIWTQEEAEEEETVIP